jgi:hypothetical protein
MSANSNSLYAVSARKSNTYYDYEGILAASKFPASAISQDAAQY